LGKVKCLGLSDYIFKRVLGGYVKRLNEMRLKFLGEMKMFVGWDKGSLGGLLNHMYIRNPLMNEDIYCKGDINRNIYIVISGELEILIDFDEFQERNQNREVKEKSNIQKFREKYLKSEKNKKKKEEISLFKLAKGNHFGDEEGFLPDVKQYTVRAKSNNVKIFLIPKDVFFPYKFRKS
jgi:CRP-like cAMP-binding protein